MSWPAKVWAPRLRAMVRVDDRSSSRRPISSIHADRRSRHARGRRVVRPDDVEFVSPFVAVLNDDPSGVIHGKEALSAYFARAFPDLRFEPLDALVGVDSITLYYVSVGGRLAA